MGCSKGHYKISVKVLSVNNGYVGLDWSRQEKIHKVFGTIILDEMHHVSSPTFNRIIDSNYCRYKIGLSGTIERKDGKHVVFRDYFGNKLFQPPKENYMVPAALVNVWRHSEKNASDLSF